MAQSRMINTETSVEGAADILKTVFVELFTPLIDVCQGKTRTEEGTKILTEDEATALIAEMIKHYPDIIRDLLTAQTYFTFDDVFTIVNYFPVKLPFSPTEFMWADINLKGCRLNVGDKMAAEDARPPILNDAIEAIKAATRGSRKKSFRIMTIRQALGMSRAEASAEEQKKKEAQAKKVAEKLAEDVTRSQFYVPEHDRIAAGGSKQNEEESMASEFSDDEGPISKKSKQQDMTMYTIHDVEDMIKKQYAKFIVKDIDYLNNSTMVTNALANMKDSSYDGKFETPVLEGYVVEEGLAEPTLAADDDVHPDMSIIHQFALGVYHNGKIEAGIESNTMAGVGVTNYVRVPKNIAGEQLVVVNCGQYTKTLSSHQLDGGIVYRTKGQYFAKINGSLVVVTLAKRVMYDAPKIVRFVAANIDWANAFMVRFNFKADDQLAIKSFLIGCRFAALIMGAIVTPHDAEFTFVDAIAIPKNAPEVMNVSKEIVANMETYVTFVVARGLSYRKCNHATGSPTPTGIIKKLMATLSWVDQSNLRAFTEVVYHAIHPASPHVMITLACTDDDYAWCAFDPRFGRPENIKPQTSLALRAGKEGSVAGTAWIADSVTVLEMLVREQLSLLIRNSDQVASLCYARRTAAMFGMACHQGANWFMKANPFGYRAVPISQRDPLYVSLITELAIISSHYYSESTISLAPALVAAAKENKDTNIADIWRSLADLKGSHDKKSLTLMYLMIKGGISSDIVDGLVSGNQEDINVSYAKFKSLTTRQTELLGLPKPLLPPKAAFITGLDEAKATYDAIQARKGARGNFLAIDQ